MNARDDINFNLQFISLIKKNSILYNINLPEYSNRDKVNTAWSSISKNTGLTVAECKKKWKNIRACFTRHLNRQNLKVNVIDYYLAEQLNFLLPFTKPRKWSSTGYARNSSRSEKSVQEIFIKQEQEESNPDIDLSSLEKYAVSDDEEELQNLITVTSKSAKKFIENVPNQNASKGLQTDGGKLTDSDATEYDPDLSFFKSVLPDVKIMSADQKRRLKIGVLQLIGNILAEDPLESVSTTPSSSCSTGGISSTKYY